MTQRHPLLSQPLYSAVLAKRMLAGAGIALAVIIIFLLGVNDADPAWGKFWMIRPLVIVPLAGAGGAAFYHFTGPLRKQGGWIMFWTFVLNVFVYIIAFWIGSVLGLDGTLWN